MSSTTQGRSARIRRPVHTRTRRRVPRNRRKPNYKLLLGLFFTAALVSCAVSFSLQTPMLVVKEIRISGVRLADEARVQAAAKTVLGRNILLLSKNDVLARIRRMPEVRQVRMGRVYPNKVWIRVWERRPDAVIVAADRCCMVQLDGYAFHSVPSPVRGVPVVEVAGCRPVGEGRRCSAQGVRYALAALACARKERLPVAKISVDPIGDMCLNMEGGYYVKLGQPDEIARKMSILRSTLSYKPSIGKEAVYIDLSYPSAPAWKPKAEAG